jgi:hypothetical protein
MAINLESRVVSVQLSALALTTSTECNHWFINVRIADGSVRFHMTVNADSGDTLYDVQQSAHAVTGRAIQTYTFMPTVPLTVRAVDEAIKSRNLHRFEFGPEGSGCQHWA